MSYYVSKAYALANQNDTRHIREITRYLSLDSTDKILEIGCGRGFVAQKVQQLVPETYGVDVNPQCIENGVANNLQVMDAGKLEFKDQHFDKVYSFHTIEHVPDPRDMLSEIGRVLKPGGRALLVYPAEPIRGLFSIPAACVIFKNPLRARRIHLHKIRPRKIQEMINDSNLKHIESTFSFFTTPQYFTVLEKEAVT